MSDISAPTPAEGPTALPTDLPGDSTPAQPSEPSPISDAALPALVEQLRPIFAEVVSAAVNEAIAAVPTPTLRPGTVTTVDMTTKEATVTLDEGTEASTDVGTAVAQIVSEMPVVNDRVMVLFVPPNAAFIIGIVGGSGVPAGVVCAYTGVITSASGGSADTAPPRGWLWAYGQDYEGAKYPALWAAIGTTYGTGSATGSGKVPDMRGRMPLGLDNMGGSDAGRTSVANVLGTAGGAESHTLATANLPSHTHDLSSHTHSFSGSASGSISGSFSGSGSTNNPGDHVHGVSWAGYGVAQTGAGPPNAAGSDVVNTTSLGGGHSHSVTVSGSISGSLSGGSVSGTTGGGSGSTGAAGSGSAVTHLPPYLVVHWIVKA
jgi:microcystin-dependent protein